MKVVLWEIESKRKKYGIETPFPQRDLHLSAIVCLRKSRQQVLYKRNDGKFY